MRIDPAAEEPTRDLFGHALRGEHEEFQRVLAGMTGETLSNAITLAATIAAYVCVDACGGEKPTDEDLRKFADTLAEVDKHYSLTSNEVNEYLARAVFGGEPVHEVLAAEDAVRFPFIVGVYLVAGYSDDEKAWWDYLDEVEAAIEAAPDPS